MGLQHFKAQQEKVYRDVFLNTDLFAEEVTYIPYLEGNPFSVVVTIEEEEQPILEDSDQTLIRMERIIVQCSRDKYATNSRGKLLGGITTPRVRDKLLRSRDRDPLQKPYVFQREILHTTRYMWRLVFARRLQQSKGVSGSE